jgi:hypothetical protein
MKRILFSLVSLGMAFTGALTPLGTAIAAPSPSPSGAASSTNATDSTAGRSLNLITSPLPIDLSTKPGTTVSADLRIKQADGVPETLQLSLLKFAAFGDAGKPQLLDRGPGDDYFDWVKFDKTHFTAPSDVWQTIHMTINVPKSAANGYYYAVTFTRAGDAVRQPGTANALAGGTAILVLLNAEVPNQKRTMDLVSFQADHRFYEFLPSNFNIRFHNTGNIHLVPNGDVFVTKASTQVATLPINAEQGNILPNSFRVFLASWEDGWPHNENLMKGNTIVLDSKNNPKTHLVYANGKPNASAVAPHFRFGKYTAHLLAVYDNGTRDVPIEATVSFWVIPWRFLLAVLALTLLIGFGIWALARSAVGSARRMGHKKGRR